MKPLNRVIMFAVLGVIGVALWASGEINVGTQASPLTLIARLSGVCGLLLNFAAIWTIGWEAPKFVRAVQRQADQTARLVAARADPLSPPPQATDAETDLVASKVFDAYRRFAARHPEFARGVDEQTFERMSLIRKQQYRSFLARAVAFFAATYDVAGDDHIKWKRTIWDVLGAHDAACRKWGSEFGIKDFGPRPT